MEELQQLAINIHIVIVICILILSLWYLLLTQKGEGKSYVRNIKKFLPVYYVFLIALLTSGFMILSARNFEITPKIIVMIIVFILMILISLVGYPKLKQAWIRGDLISYKKNMRIILIINIVLIIILGIA